MKVRSSVSGQNAVQGAIELVDELVDGSTVLRRAQEELGHDHVLPLPFKGEAIARWAQRVTDVSLSASQALAALQVAHYLHSDDTAAWARALWRRCSIPRKRTRSSSQSGADIEQAQHHDAHVLTLLHTVPQDVADSAAAQHPVLQEYMQGSDRSWGALLLCLQRVPALCHPHALRFACEASTAGGVKVALSQACRVDPQQRKAVLGALAHSPGGHELTAYASQLDQEHLRNSLPAAQLQRLSLLHLQPSNSSLLAAVADCSSLHALALSMSSDDDQETALTKALCSALARLTRPRELRVDGLRRLGALAEMLRSIPSLAPLSILHLSSPQSRRWYEAGDSKAFAQLSRALRRLTALEALHIDASWPSYLYSGLIAQLTPRAMPRLHTLALTGAKHFATWSACASSYTEAARFGKALARVRGVTRLSLRGSLGGEVRPVVYPLATLPRLAHLDISCMGKLDSDEEAAALGAALEAMPALRGLDISKAAQCTPALARAVGRATQLTWLSCQHNPCTHDTQPAQGAADAAQACPWSAAVANLARLRYLHLGGERERTANRTVHVRALAPQLQHLPELRELYLHGNRVCSIEAATLGPALAALPHLTRLTLWTEHEYEGRGRDVWHNARWGPYGGLAGAAGVDAFVERSAPQL